MTIIPEPVQKPLRVFEIVFGLLCVAVGCWMLAQSAFWMFGSVPRVEIRSGVDAALILVKSVYLLGFGGFLIVSGYVSLIFWVVAAAILVAFPVTTGLLG